AGQCAGPQFPRWESFDAGIQPSAIVKADFNADGKLDLAVANNFSSEVSLLLGDGDGGFQPPVKFSIPAHATAISTADFNNDGKADVAVAGFTNTQGDGAVAVLLGNGAGSFGAPTGFAVGRGPSSIVAADFNGDGKADLAVGIQSPDIVTVVFGDGSGGFSGATTLNSGGTPRALAAADLNGDGKIDIAAANTGSNNVSIFLNNGAGNFSGPTNHAVGPDPSAVAVGDFNNDRRPDLVVANSTAANIPGSVSVLLGDGSGGFSAATNYAAGIGPRAVVVGDFDRDGRADLAVANYYSHNVSILLGDGAGHFTVAAGYVGGRGPQSLAAGDFNLDGKIDLASLDQVKQAVVVLVGKGDGRFSTPATYVTNNAPMSMAIGDFNEDGKADAAVAHFSFNPSKVSLHLGDGRGGLRLTQSFDVGADPRSLTAADFNRDGNLDLATLNTGSGNVSVLLGTGTGGFAAARTFSTGTDVFSLSMRPGDFNGDGRVDLAVANSSFPGPNGTVSILLGDGAGNFGAPAQFASGGANSSDVAPGDFNGDGKTDLLVANGGTSTVSLLAGDGAGGFAAPVNFNVGSSPRSIAVGDFNGDSKPDAAVANYGTQGGSTSPVSILLGDGAGGFNAGNNVAAGPELGQVLSADLNGDGKLDLITKSTSYEILLLQGDGAGNFSPAQTVAVDYGTIATGDLNGDGVPDIVNSGGNQLTVLLNGCGAGAPNPVNESAFFVRQHYLDFLSREPDASGFNFWVAEIENCGADSACREVKRVNVSAAFFLSIELQQTGYLSYRTHKAAFGNLPGKPVPITRDEMLEDIRVIGNGVVVNADGWEQKLEQNKQAYFGQFAASARFTSLYPQTLTPEQFVDALNANAGGALSQSERDALVAELKDGVKTRAQALRAVVEDADLARAEFNKAFVLMQYFGYLRRNPDELPDADFDGYNFWLTKLNQFGGDYIQAEMVKAFIQSDEYARRFGQ
ncbi:MAG: FG-GAP-like repeat-containing protein, partial [Pyrinomonadaceae bacterium]